ncbi:ATP-binding protein [Profundibacter sp.]
MMDDAFAKRSSWLSIRLRLLLALGALAAATILVGVLSWYALARANLDLEKLHNQTLLEVTSAMSLSKRSNDLTTSAPFLLGLKSPYLIHAEAADLLTAIKRIGQQWPQENGQASVSEALKQLELAVNDLIGAADNLDMQRSKVLTQRATLGVLSNRVEIGSDLAGISDEERQVRGLIRSIINVLSGAAYSDSLPGLGEFRRKYTALVADPALQSARGEMRDALQQMQDMTRGPAGLFTNRRKALDQNLVAQNALFRIRYNSSLVGNMALDYAQNAEEFLSQKRRETASSIRFTKLVILAVGVASVTLALLSALFISGYVTGNIKAISSAMQRLAQGDRSTRLPRPEGAMDEIGVLLQSFRVFRANAMRLDRSNRQLNQRNTLFEKVFSNISDGAAIIDSDGGLTAVNPSFASVLQLRGGTHDNNLDMAGILATSVFAASARAQKLGCKFSNHAELHSADGYVIELRCSRLPDGGEVWMFSDATERRNIEERLGQIQRIESLGKVTGEVAHDFANILSTISGNLHLLETKRSGADSAGILRRISSAVEIGTSLTQRLLAFARKQHLAPEKTELNALVAGLEDLISIGLKDGVSLQTSLAREDIFVQVDPGQLESAILNLCLNSNQAINDTGKDAGQISITIRASQGSMAEIIITDDGCGMEKTTLKRAMEPFFSARGDGMGTGLGLPSVYGFVKQSGGEFHIESVLNEGTTVRLGFPLVEGRTEISGPSKTPMRVLLVEDDLEILTSTASLLRAMGHHVDEVSQFGKANEMLQKTGRYDLLLTDIHLDNGNSGWHLIEQCLTGNQPPKMIAMSGRLPLQQVITDRYGGKVACLSKPVLAENLAAAMTLSALHN